MSEYKYIYFDYFCSLEAVFFPLVVGQYDGRCKPLPEYHAKITGFDERVCF